MIDLPVVQAMSAGQAETRPVEVELAPLFAEILAFVSGNQGPTLDGPEQPAAGAAVQSADTQSSPAVEHVARPAPLMIPHTALDTVDGHTGLDMQALALSPESDPAFQETEGLEAPLLDLPEVPTGQYTQTPQAPGHRPNEVGTPVPVPVVSMDANTLEPAPHTATSAGTITDPAPAIAVTVPPTPSPDIANEAISAPAPKIVQPTAATVTAPPDQVAVAGHSELPRASEPAAPPGPVADPTGTVQETTEAAPSAVSSPTGTPEAGRLERPDPPALVQRIDRWISSRPTTPNSLVLEFGESGDFRVTVALRAAGLVVTVAGAGMDDIPWIQELSATLESRGLDAEVSSDAESRQRSNTDSEEDSPNWNPPPPSKPPAREQGLRL